MDCSSIYFWVFFSLFSSKQGSACSAEGPCRELAFPAFLFFADKRLVNHTIRNVKVRDMDACEFLCYKEHNCVSINFENKVNTEGTFNCELNNSAHGEYNEDLVEAKHYFYHGTENACGKSPCKNGGTCQSGFTKKKYHCLCPPGFMGRICSNDIDECDENSHKCDENAECKNTRGSYRCNCKSGYSGHGYKCTDVDECSAAGINKCDANAECTNTKGSYSCKCRAGYVGDGRTCTEKCHGIIPKHRADCGQPGISRDKCEQDNGCCYDDSAGESFPYCFYGRDRQVVMDSVIISNNGLYLRHLEHFLAPLVGENSKWKLCYRSSTDRNVDYIFHGKCDGKNNTVTIIKKNEFVFGGFTDIPWEGIEGQGVYENTSKAFIFSLRNKEELGPFKSMVTEPSKAIFNQKYVGPTFGRDDIRIDRYRSGVKSSSGYTHFGRSYSVPASVNNSKTVLAGTHDFEPDEVEVFYLD